MTPAEEQIRAALAAGPTPGPWWVDPNFCRDVRAEGTEISVAYQASDEGKKVTVPGPINVEPATAEANAKLIAACNPANVAELLAELDWARKHAAQSAVAVSHIADENAKLLAELTRLRAEVEALRKDAERYQFLRDDFSPMGLNIDGQHAWAYRRNATLKGPTLDAAIDAAKGGGNG